MCGIIGIINSQQNNNIYQQLLNSLIQLQNRGYDSAGIGLLNNDNFLIHKYASDNNQTALEKLQTIKTDYDVNIGIGHNRWATHGAKTDINSHPHISDCGTFLLVHNGIIDNYNSLKDVLIYQGYKFISQTDTEIIVNLISYYYKITKNTFNAIKYTIGDLKGTYSLVIINRLENNTLYCVRNGSPLLVAKTDDFAIISSEQSGFCNMVNTYITLQNNDICVLKINNSKINLITYYEYEKKLLTIGKYDLTPFPFKHWTIKEIFEQPETILNAIDNGKRIKSSNEVTLAGLEHFTDKLKIINNIILLGCGTSYFAGLHSIKYFKSLCNFNIIQVIDGADFDISDVPRNDINSTALILISQSGETKDLHRCIQIAKENNIITIGIINVVDSLIAREVDCVIYLNAGREFAVASTKAFTSQTICLSMLATWFSQIHNIHESKRKQLISDLSNLSNNIKNTLIDIHEKIKSIAQYIIEQNFSNMFVLGKGSDEAIAKEGSLKIKEISYIHAEGYSASSLKHGPFALLDENLPVILLNTDNVHNAKVVNCYEEVKSRKAPIIFISSEMNNLNNPSIKSSPELNIFITENITYQSLLAVLPLQIMAYYLSINKGINPDVPKNLAKVVTVE
jgi:glucosamine--fructose-6-phosphate aminotransferase (isomerizing)